MSHSEEANRTMQQCLERIGRYPTQTGEFYLEVRRPRPDSYFREVWEQVNGLRKDEVEWVVLELPVD
jgi:hypothetical protein